MSDKNSAKENIKISASIFFEELRNQAADIPEMTLDEINAEIKAARKEKRISKCK